MKNHATQDHFLEGRLHFRQPRDGYRFSIDAVLVSACVTPLPQHMVIDLGTGCGVIPIILAHRHPGICVVGVEIQTELAELARSNIAANHMQDRIVVIEADMRKLDSRRFNQSGDWVVCNPPYRRSCSGRVNPDGQRAAARHEIHINLKELVRTARALLKMGGRFVTIYPCERLVDLISAMRDTGIEPKWLRTVHSFEGQKAKWILVQGTKGGRPDIEIRDPLILYHSDGTYSAEVQSMMAESPDADSAPTSPPGSSA